MIREFFRRVSSLALALCMIVAMIPAAVLPASAATVFDVNTAIKNWESISQGYYWLYLKWNTDDAVSSGAVNSNITKSYIDITFSGSILGSEFGQDTRYSTFTWSNVSIPSNNVLRLNLGVQQLETLNSDVYAYLKVPVGVYPVSAKLESSVGSSRGFGGTIELLADSGAYNINIPWLSNNTSYQKYKVGNIQLGQRVWSTEDKEVFDVNAFNAVMEVANVKLTSQASSGSLPAMGSDFKTQLSVYAFANGEADPGPDLNDILLGGAKVNVTDVLVTGDGVSYPSDAIEVTDALQLVVHDAIYDYISEDKTSLTLTVSAKAQRSDGSGPEVESAGINITLSRPSVSVSYDLDDISSTGAETVSLRKTYTATLSAADGFALPASVEVTAGSQPLTAGTGYTYNSTTGKISIPGKSVTGNISIKAAGVKTIQTLPGSVADVFTDYDENAWITTDELKLDAAENWTVSESEDGVFSDSITIGAEEGTSTKTVYVKDPDGTVYKAEIKINCDTEKPVVGDAVLEPETYADTVTVKLPIEDETSGVKSVSVSCDGTTYTYDTETDSFTADKNGTYYIVVTDNAGNVSEKTVEVTNVKTAIMGTLAITGDAVYGKTLIANYTGTETNVSYQWYRDGVAVDGETGTSYLLGTDDIGKSITVKVSGMGEYGGSVQSAATGKVAKATPTLTSPEAKNGIEYGKTLANVGLTDGWTWSNAQTVPTVINSGYEAYYIPADTDNYDWSQISGWDGSKVVRTVSVSVTKVKPSYNAPEELSADYKDTLADVQGLPAGFSWQDQENTPVGNVGRNLFYVKYTPEDTNNYVTVENIAVYINVSKIAPEASDFTSVTAGTSTTYNGSAVTAEVTTEQSGMGKVTVKYFDKDGTPLEGAPSDAGEYSYKIEVAGGDNFEGSSELISDPEWKFTIAKKNIAEAVITLGAGLTFNGKEQTQAITSVVVDGLSVTYNVSGNKGTNATGYTLTVTGNGNFEGTATKTWSIAKKNIAEAVITLGAGLTFNGKEQTQVITSVVVDGLSVTYTVSGNKGTDATGYTLTVMGNGNFEGTATKTWSIAKKNIADAVITLDDKVLTYNGETQTKEIVSVVLEGFELSYDVSGTEAVNAGTHTVTITGNGNFEGTAAQTWSIEKKKLTVSADDKSAYCYTSIPELTYKVDGLVSGDALIKEPTMECDANIRVAGKYDIVPVGADAGTNYEITAVNGTLTLEKRNMSVEIDGPKICNGGITCPAFRFTDVDTNQWYHEALDYVLVNNIMNGVANDLFDPLGSTNRAMVVTILWRLEGCPSVNYKLAFEDVDNGEWYTEAVRWAAFSGIAEGYGNGLFGTFDAISREQLAAMLYRYASYKKTAESAEKHTMAFADMSDVSAYALDAVKWCNMKGIINGRPGDLIAPKDNASRTEVAAMIYRFMEE